MKLNRIRDVVCDLVIQLFRIFLIISFTWCTSWCTSWCVSTTLSSFLTESSVVLCCLSWRQRERERERNTNRFLRSALSSELLVGVRGGAILWRLSRRLRRRFFLLPLRLLLGVCIMSKFFISLWCARVMMLTSLRREKNMKIVLFLSLSLSEPDFIWFYNQL